MSFSPLPAEIQRLYVSFVNRPIDPLGLQFWQAQIAANNGDTTALIAALGSASEFTAIYAGLSNAQAVDAVYMHLFGRPGEANGIAFWSAALDGGNLTLANVVMTVANGAIGQDLTVLTNKVSAADSFLSHIDTTAEIVGYAGEAANLIARAWLATVTDDASLALVATPAAIDNVLLSIVNVIPGPHLSANALSYDEGQTGVFTITMPTAASGVVLDYAISGVGISSADVVGGLSGSVTTQNGRASISIPLVNDASTEGGEMLKLTIFNSGSSTPLASSLFVINDTSTGAGTGNGTLAETVQKLYIAYLNRPADPAGLAYWVTEIGNNGGSTTNLDEALAKTPEFNSLYAGLSNTQAVNALYTRLFGHAADATTLAFVLPLLDSRLVTIDKIVMNLAITVQEPDLSVVLNKIAAAQKFESALAASNEITAYAGADANAVARAWLATVTDKASLTSATTTDAFAKLMVDIAHPGPVATCALTVGAAVYDEGQTGVFTLSTKNVADGTVFNYVIAGNSITAGDITGGLTGSAVVQNGMATISVPLANDKTTEGFETLILTASATVGGGGIASSAKFLIDDTSIRAIDTSLVGIIQKLYIAFFNRPADPDGLSYWVDQATKNGGDASNVANAFGASAEFRSIYAGMSSTQSIDAIYVNLFGRHAEPGGLAFWGGLLDSGALGLATISIAIANGAQADDLTALTNKISAAEIFTNSLDSGGTIIYSGDLANALVRAWLGTVTTDASYASATTPDAISALITSMTVAPGFTLTPGASAYEEGQTGVFTLTTTNVADGTVLRYAISGNGIGADDVIGGLSGKLTVHNGTATISLPLANDRITEGSEALKLRLTSLNGATEYASGGFSILDTSKAIADNTLSANVQKLYVAFFARPADFGGLGYWVDQAHVNGDDTVVVSNAFSASSEYKNNYAGLESAQVIETLYLNLFGRDAEPGALAFWGPLYQNATLPLAKIALAIAEGAQNADRVAITNKIIAAAAFTNSTQAFPGYDGGDSNIFAKAWLSTVTDDASLALALSKLTPIIETAVAQAGRDYRVTPGATSYNEGETAHFALTTKGVADGTRINYSLSGSGITLADVTGGLSGTATVSGGKANIDVALAADHALEGSEILVLRLASIATASEPALNVGTAMITILDTSTNHAPPVDENISAQGFGHDGVALIGMPQTDAGIGAA